MQKTIGVLVAALGSALSALSLTGSIQASGNSDSISPQLAADFHGRIASAKRQYTAGNYLEARESFLATASLAARAGFMDIAGKGFNNAGAAALGRQDFRDALEDFRNAERAFRRSRQRGSLASTMNNIASLYLQMGDPGPALEAANDAFSGDASPDAVTRPRILFQMATALSRLHRFNDAIPIYRRATDELIGQGDYVTAIRVLAGFGSDALDAGRENEADGALTEAMQLIDQRHMATPVNVLRGLARAKSREGHFCGAATLFDATIQAPPGLMPRWLLYADRGEFRLSQDDLRGALADFREAGMFAAEMRADVVPADQDRVALENGLSRIAAGLVEAGNRLAQKTPDKGLLRETFDAAERDRLWSLRALVPTVDDWRGRLPARYWDLLAQYQTVEGALIANAGKSMTALTKEASSLSLQLQQMEAAAGEVNGADRVAGPGESVSALAHVRDTLDEDSVLFSFHITGQSGWLWAVDRYGVDVYKSPALEQIKREVNAFSRAIQDGQSEAAAAMGRQIYQDLFGSVSASYLAHKRWLLELDGPLFDLPFAALSVSSGTNPPAYLIERAALQVIPGALLLERHGPPADGEFLGIGDPIYNLADKRHQGKGVKTALALPRLTGTEEELRECSRPWGPARTRLLMGVDATAGKVEAALQSGPAIIHFATHIVRGPGEYASGMIALSLEPSGALGLLGPREIVAHPVTAALVVLNGCHSAQGDTLPSAGLMGLTRAWIGAGAGAVLATRWDIPDDAARTFITSFYRALKANPKRAPAYALQQSQLELLRGAGNNLNLSGAYFLLGRA